MTIARFWRHRLVRHGLGWALLLGGIAGIGREVLGVPGARVGHSLVLMALLAGPIYAHFGLLTHLLERRRYGRYAAAAVATALLGGLLLDAADYGWRQLTGPVEAEEYGLVDLANSATSVGLAMLLATGVRYFRRGLLSHYQMQELRARQLETELSLLKAQVNQHFLFNTLNNLYGLSLAAPEQMPEALLQLAGLMRYQLDSSRQAAVTVGTEAEYLANYIGLEKLRLRANTRVEFVTDLPHPDRPLAALLLLPLVENCFKHAVSPSGENTIRIHLTQTDTSLTLRTDNSIPAHFRPVPSGLGLPNLRARLQQFYPGARHRFTVEATESWHTATLMLAV